MSDLTLEEQYVFEKMAGTLESAMMSPLIQTPLMEAYRELKAHIDPTEYLKVKATYDRPETFDEWKARLSNVRSEGGQE